MPPSESQAQNRFMHAVAEGDVKGVAPKVGQDFVAADHGRKIGALPEHVGKGRKPRTGLAKVGMAKP